MLFGNIVLRRCNISREINTLSDKLVGKLDDLPEIGLRAILYQCGSNYVHTILFIISLVRSKYCMEISKLDGLSK